MKTILQKHHTQLRWIPWHTNRNIHLQRGPQEYWFKHEYNKKHFGYLCQSLEWFNSPGAQDGHRIIKILTLILKIILKYIGQKVPETTGRDKMEE